MLPPQLEKIQKILWLSLMLKSFFDRKLSPNLSLQSKTMKNRLIKTLKLRLNMKYREIPVNTLEYASNE